MTKTSKKIVLSIFICLMTLCAVLFLTVNTSGTKDAYAMGTFSNNAWLESQHPGRVTTETLQDGSIDITLKTTDEGVSLSRAYYSEIVDIDTKGLYFSLTVKTLNLYGGLRVSLMTGGDDYPMSTHGDGFSIYLWDESAWGYPQFTNFRADVYAYGRDGVRLGNDGWDLVQENRLYGNCSQNDPKYYDPATDLYPTLYFSILKDGTSGYKCEIRKSPNAMPTTLNIPNSNLPANSAFTANNCHLLISPEYNSYSDANVDYKTPSTASDIKVNVANVYNGNDANVTKITPNSERVDEVSVAGKARTLPIKNYFSYTTAFGPSTAQFTYTSSDTSVATISGENIVIPSLANGTTTITISFGSVSGSFVLNVDSIDTGMSDKSLTIGKYLTLNVYSYFLESGVPKMKFVMMGKQKTVIGVSSDSSKSEYKFSLGGIAPEHMTEQITMTLMNGDSVIETKTTTLVEYLDALYARSGKNEKYKNFIVNAINYGAEAQKYNNYKVNALATSVTTISQEDLNTYAKSIAPEVDATKLVVSDATLAQKIEVTNAGVKFEKGNSLYIKLTTSNDIEKDKLLVTFAGKKVDIVEEGNGVYLVKSPAISMLGFDDAYDFVVSYNGTKVSTFTYSAESYVYSKAEGNAEGDMAHATYNFGKAIARYIGKEYDFAPEYTFSERDNINTTSQNYTATGAIDYMEELWDTPTYAYAEDLTDGSTDLDALWTDADKGNVKGIWIDSPVTVDGKKTKIVAYIGYPEGASATNKVPAIVLVHGGGGTAYPQWVKYWNDLGFAAISIDTEGGEPSQGIDCITNDNGVHIENNCYYNGAIDSNFTAGPSNNEFGGTSVENLKDQWMYHATSAAILAVSVLSDLDCVDTQKIGMTGISWGSVITSIVLGYDDRITFAMPVYGGITISQSGGWISSAHKNQTTIDRWDLTSALERTNAKVFYVTSTADEPFSPDVASRSAQAAGGFVTYQEGFSHGQKQGAMQPYLPEFAKYVCGLSANYLEVMQHPNCDNHTMLLRSYGNVAINSVKLYYTTDAKIITHSSVGTPTTWKSVNIPFTQGQTSFNISTTESYRYAYATITYNNDYQVSTYIWQSPDYDFDKSMEYIWDADVVYNESVMFLKDSAGEVEDKTLLYEIDEVLEVRNNTLGVLYEEFVDYEVVNGKLRLIEGGRIEAMEYNDYYIDSTHERFINSVDQQFSSISQNGRYYIYCEDDYLTSRQVSVTYKKAGNWAGPEVTRDQAKLANTISKLENKQDIKIVYYGDSVMTGCNSSAHIGVAPYMPRSYELVNQALAKHYGYTDASMVNGVMTGQGGWTSYNGLNGADSSSQDDKFNANAFTTRVLNENADLLVLHFGANDATWDFTAEQYISYIDGMITALRSQNANAEVLIVSMSMPNDDAIKGDLQKNMAGVYKNYPGVQDHDRPAEYVDAIKNYIQDKPYVAFADSTSVTRYALERKDWCDVTGNNINHPNDFFVRLEAQLMTYALCK